MPDDIILEIDKAIEGMGDKQKLVFLNSLQIMIGYRVDALKDLIDKVD
jgi:hypothetical protein